MRKRDCAACAPHRQRRRPRPASRPVRSGLPTPRGDVPRRSLVTPGGAPSAAASPVHLRLRGTPQLDARVHTPVAPSVRSSGYHISCNCNSNCYVQPWMPGSSLRYGQAILMAVVVDCWPLVRLAAGLLLWEERGTEARHREEYLAIFLPRVDVEDKTSAERWREL